MRIKKQIFKDYFINQYLKIRYWFIRIFMYNKLSNISDFDKDGYENTFFDNFTEKSWSKSGVKTKWKVGEHWGMVHPDKLNMYYGAPSLKENKGLFKVEYKPAVWNINGKPTIIPFKASLLSSHYSFKQTYGRFECRCTLPKEPYAWSAFWIWGEP